MKVLVITGDKNFKAGHRRFELQRSAVETFEVVYFGRGNLWPHIPEDIFDVVTVQDPFWRGLFAWRVAKRLKAKFNVQVHADLSAQPFVRRLLARVVLRHADSVRVVSEKIKQQVQQLSDTSAPKVLPLYIEADTFRQSSKEPHSPKIILWIGRFEEEKDPHAAIEILRSVRESGMDAQLIMLGKGGLEASLKAAAKTLPVVFPGWQHPLPYLQKSDVVLSTSRHESYGASIIEALAAGVPVVAPDIGVAKEAGAIVVSREKLASATLDTLRSPREGKLLLPLLSADAWGKAWRATLE